MLVPVHSQARPSGHRCCPLHRAVQFGAARKDHITYAVKRKAAQAITEHRFRGCKQACRAYSDDAIDVSAQEVLRGEQEYEAFYDEGPAHGMRPWTFLIPTLDEVATNRDWHKKARLLHPRTGNLRHCR